MMSPARTPRLVKITHKCTELAEPPPAGSSPASARSAVTALMPCALMGWAASVHSAYLSCTWAVSAWACMGHFSKKWPKP